LGQLIHPAPRREIFTRMSPLPRVVSSAT
jgi:hypothetical protein